MAVGERPSLWLGKSVKRKEDGRFLVGRGNYVDDVKLPGMLHMAILRSPFAHARIRSIETSAAKEAPGVVAVVTGASLAARSEEHTSELQSLAYLVCRLLLEKKKKKQSR